jgi:UDP-N-acetylmuramoyl-tripeptide--D-alanyl-D-alanine ligase
VYTGAAVDTKKIEPGNLFFALRGARTDGHHYLKEAAIKGASLLVIRESYQGNTSFSCPILRVPDPLIALQNHAQSLLEELRPTICAITGSYGKTTTKSLLEQMLVPYKKTMVTPSNHN